MKAFIFFAIVGLFYLIAFETPRPVKVIASAQETAIAALEGVANVTADVWLKK